MSTRSLHATPLETPRSPSWDRPTWTCICTCMQVSGYGESPLFAACMQSEIGAVCILHEAGASLSFVHEMTDFTLLGVAVRDLDERRRESYRWGAAHLRPRLYTAAAKREAQLAVVRYLLETASIASVEMELCAHEPTRNPLFRTCHESNPRPLLGCCRCLMAAVAAAEDEA